MKTSAILPATTLFIALSLSQAQAAVVNVPLGGAGVATQSTDPFGGVPSRGIDGNTDGNWGAGSVTHTGDGGATPTPFWMVDLGVTTRISSVSIFNRTDCCGGRLSDITIQVLDNGNNVVSTLANDFNNANVLGGGGGVGSSPGTNFTFSGNEALGRKLRITRNSASGFNDPGVISLAEVQVFSNNLALDAIANGGSVSQIGGDAFPAANAINGNLGDFSHTSNSNGSTPDGFLLNLGRAQNIDGLILHNRDNCCGGRLRDITVQLLAPDASTVLWTSAILNPDNVLGGGSAVFTSGPATLNLDLHQLFGSAISAAQYVRVTRAPSTFSGDGNDNNILSLGEIQVFGVPEPSRALLLMAGFVLAAGFRRRG